MKTIQIIIILFAFFGTKVIAQESGEFIVPLSKPGQRGNLKVDIKKGSITVHGTSRNDILIKYNGTDKGGHKKENVNGMSRISGGAMELEIIENNNQVKVESGSWNKGVNLIIEVPVNFDLNLDTYNNGDIYVKNIEGDIVADNYNGKITAEDISGSLLATTYNGPINASFNKVKPDTPMAFTTYNGDVDLTFPGGIKGSFKMKTSRGEIYSGFDMNMLQTEPVKKEDKKSGSYKVYIDDWVRGSVNGGGPEIMIMNYNGDIFIRKGK